MDTRRREFVLGVGAALFGVGCRGNKRSEYSADAGGLPGASWPDVEPPEVPHVLPPIVFKPEVMPQTAPPTGNQGTPQNPIPRAKWTSAPVGGRNVYPM